MTGALFGGRDWTIQDIASASGARPEKAGWCQVQFLGKRYELKRESLSDRLRGILRRSHVNTYYVIFRFQVTSETGHTRKIWIRTLPTPNPGNPVQIYCDCPDFKYRSAYSLQKHGALYRSARTDAKLGEAITVAPRRQSTTVLCKHALAAVQDLMSNFQRYLG